MTVITLSRPLERTMVSGGLIISGPSVVSVICVHIEYSGHNINTMRIPYRQLSVL